MEIYIKQIQNGFVVNDYTSGKIWHELTIELVANRVIVIGGGEKSREEEAQFDPLPSDLPQPPEGFVYFGEKPIYRFGNLENHGVMAIGDNGEWVSALGHTRTFHYAVRIGSQAHRDAIQAHKTGQPV